jgi:hypothetical protein
LLICANDSPAISGVVVLFQIQKQRLFLQEGRPILSHFLAFQDEGMLAFLYEPRVVVAQMRPLPANHGESLLINHVIQALGSDSMLFQSKRGTAQHEIMKKCKQQIISTNLNAWDVGDDNERSVMLVGIQECLKHLCSVMDSKRNHIDVFIGHMNISPMLFIRCSFFYPEANLTVAPAGVEFDAGPPVFEFTSCDHGYVE